LRTLPGSVPDQLKSLPFPDSRTGDGEDAARKQRLEYDA
jgi:hypothetical protein